MSDAQRGELIPDKDEIIKFRGENVRLGGQGYY